jgi:hypothetical protein
MLVALSSGLPGCIPVVIAARALPTIALVRLLALAVLVLLALSLQWLKRPGLAVLL